MKVIFGNPEASNGESLEDSITYRQGNDLSVDEFIELLRASSLGERRPIHDRGIMQSMLENANLTITAWDDQKLIGVARSLTDFSYIAYLSDLAVHLDYQRQGIGKELMQKTQQALKPSCSILLLAAPNANEYYAQLGYENHPRAWFRSSEV
jgi:predicted N-acetyltransferase YhbS